MTAANPHLKQILIAGMLAALAAALGMFTLTRQQQASKAAEPAVVHRPATTAATTAAKPESKPKPVPGPVLRVSPFTRAALAAGLPKPVAAEFADHEVVVVTLYSSHGDVDRLAEAEAESGASLGAAGFAAVDATREGASGALTRLYGVLPSPSTLVIARPDFTTPFVSLEGFADRETVAQAARNADPTPGGPAAQSAWARQAEAVCTRTTKQLTAVGAVDSAAALKTATPKVRAIGNAFLADLGALKPPAARAADVKRFVALQKQDLAFALQMASAAAAKDLVGVAAASAHEATVAKQASALAIDLGAPACASPF